MPAVITGCVDFLQLPLAAQPKLRSGGKKARDLPQLKVLEERVGECQGESMIDMPKAQAGSLKTVPTIKQGSA